MRSVSVATWMTPNPKGISPKATLPQAHAMMKHLAVRRLPVIDEEGALVGLVTIGDIREALPSDATALSGYEIDALLNQVEVDTIMAHQLVTVSPVDTIYEAARRMLKHRVSGLPVVEENRLIGIITESDIFRALIAEEPEPPVGD